MALEAQLATELTGLCRRLNDQSSGYNYKIIHERIHSLDDALVKEDINALIEVIRSGLVRNLGGITNPELYNHSYQGTKHLIENYIQRMVEAIADLGSLPTTPNDQQQVAKAAYAVFASDALAKRVMASKAPLITQQEKLDTTKQLRQAFGVSTLVMQGGSIFGLCHLGVAKALFQCGLLPRIITGTGTGALIAALVGIHSDEDLPAVFDGDREKINLTAFSGPALHLGYNSPLKQNFSTRFATLKRRVSRFWRDGHFLDIRVLEQCVRDNCGDLTFEEAFNLSGRVLNITVATGDKAGIPRVFNYISTPNVVRRSYIPLTVSRRFLTTVGLQLVWTAAVASNAIDAAWYGANQTKLLCKNQKGVVEPWAPAAEVRFRHWTQASYQGRNSPLQRLSEYFNVNHYIISQARPYMIPFLQSDMHGPSSTRDQTIWGGWKYRLTNLKNGITGFSVRFVKLRMTQLDMIGLMPPSIRRLLLDETVPKESMTLVPQLATSDFVRLLDAPTPDTLQYWIRKGEMSVWPAIAALKVRCSIELELESAVDQALETERRRKEVMKDLAARSPPSESNGERRPQGAGAGAGVAPRTPVAKRDRGGAARSKKGKTYVPAGAGG